MIKKLIPISVILALAISLGLVGVAKAGYDDVIFSADTTIGLEDLVVKAGSQVKLIAVGASDVTITLELGSAITFSSASGLIMVLDHPIATYTAGTPSTITITYNSTYPTVKLYIGSVSSTTGTLTEVNVAASSLKASTASAYTITFKTATALSAGDKIELDFGTGFTIATSADEAKVTTLTDDGTAITLAADAFSSNATTKKIIMALPATVAANSVINIVLSSTLVTNPATTSSDTAVSGIDIYTTDSAGNKIDALANQTAFNRVIDLVSGWNIFAPSQELESSALATVMAPIAGTYEAIYTLAIDTSTGLMTWQTPSTIDPLYGYAIYNKSGSTQKLPLDFAKEVASNALFERWLHDSGWHLIGYTGNSDSLVAQTSCLDGLTVSGNEEFSVIVDLTGTTAGQVPSSHAFGASTTSELASGGPTMKFAKDYGYAIFITAENLKLGGEREE